jgi:hypothetical protein
MRETLCIKIKKGNGKWIFLYKNFRKEEAEDKYKPLPPEPETQKESCYLLRFSLTPHFPNQCRRGQRKSFLFLRLGKGETRKGVLFHAVNARHTQNLECRFLPHIRPLRRV